MRTLIALIAGTVIVTQTDPGRVVADVRHALGGDAAIAALQGFAVTGSETHSAGGHNFSVDTEFLCVLPDRFLHVRRSSSPFGITTEEWGFNGDQHIRRRDSDMPYPPDPGEHDTPAQKALRDARTLANARREFTRVATAMIGLSPIDPVDVSVAGQQTIDGRSTDVLVLRAPDGYSANLFIDSTTHLPWMISWMGAPIVTATATSVIAVPRGQSPGRMPEPSFPAMPDPLSLTPVEHQLFFDDYKTADGFTWPHTLIEKIGGHVTSTVKLGKYKINPSLNPKRFDPSR